MKPQPVCRRLILIVLLAWLASGAQAALVDSGNVQAELIAEVDAIVPGQPFWVALRQVIRPGWHTYWRNPGDSGAPTTLNWSLPEGFSAGDIQWPRPERIAYGPLMNFGYHDEVVFPVQITPPSTIEATEVLLSAEGQWLVCADICIPEGARLTLRLPVAGAANPDPRHLAYFHAARQQIPQAAGIKSRATPGESAIVLWVDIPGERIASVDYFPYLEGVMENPAAQPFRPLDGGIELTITPGYDFSPGVSLDGILVVTENLGERLTSVFEISPEDAAPTVAAATPETGLLVALAFAFLGGLILNLMPCVFPVLSIKILSLMQQVGSHSTQIRAHGWAYLAGVVLSFVAVAAVLIALRAGGAQIGWGFQLQSPLVVGLLAYLFLLIGLNLFGFFELGTSVMNLGQGLANRSGLSGSFFTGVLATLVAAPCTVPFMASAVGFALTQPNVIAVLVFAALGLGMATPYLLLCYSPALMDQLPRPGPWMARFKELLAFPMFATAVWLVWVLSLQAGSGGVVAVLTGMLLLVFAIWQVRHAGRSKVLRIVSLGGALLVVLGALYLPVGLRSEEAGTVGTAAAPRVDAGYRGPVWETYSPERLAEARERGPVFVNFTAAWCITCKVNEAVALDSADVRQAFETAGVSYLKGDWTNEDPVITAALSSYQRSGVPLYLLYSDTQGRAEVLPQVLTESIVIEAVQGLVQNR
ncbi:MAG: protein-disulfide reductase DsbD family protein [Pseudomonadota bacterium]